MDLYSRVEMQVHTKMFNQIEQASRGSKRGCELNRRDNLSFTTANELKVLYQKNIFAIDGFAMHIKEKDKDISPIDASLMCCINYHCTFILKVEEVTKAKVFLAMQRKTMNILDRDKMIENTKSL